MKIFPLFFSIWKGKEMQKFHQGMQIEFKMNFVLCFPPFRSDFNGKRSSFNTCFDGKVLFLEQYFKYHTMNNTKESNGYPMSYTKSHFESKHGAHKFNTCWSQIFEYIHLVQLQERLSFVSNLTDLENCFYYTLKELRLSSVSCLKKISNDFVL